jgi:hypothetical protein
MLSVLSVCYPSGNRIWPIFIIIPKMPFILGTKASNYLFHMDLGLGRSSAILSLAYLFVSIIMLFKSSSLKNEVK